MKSLLHHLLNLLFIPREWRAPLWAAFGLLAGVALLVVHLSRAPSYLSDNPETCMNCHVMTTSYITWQHSSHAHAATCNDCHVPHDTLLRQYAFKAKDGLWHATVFTMRWEPQVIRISQRAIPVVEDNCRRCHQEVLQNVSIAEHNDPTRRCWDCHREVPHGRERSLSATPDVFRPELGPILGDQVPRIRGRLPRPIERRERN